MLRALSDVKVKSFAPEVKVKFEKGLNDISEALSRRSSFKDGPGGASLSDLEMRNRFDGDMAKKLSVDGWEIRVENGKYEIKFQGEKLPDFNGKSPEKFMNDIKGNLLDSVKKGEYKGSDIVVESNKAAREMATKLYGENPPKSIVDSMAKNIEDGMKIDIESQLKVEKPEFSDLKVDVGPNGSNLSKQEISRSSDIAEIKSDLESAANNPVSKKATKELTKGMDPARLDVSLKNESATSKIVDDLEAKAPTESSKSWWKKNKANILKWCGIAGLAGLAGFFTYSYLKSVADEKTGCFLTIGKPDGSTETTKVMGLTCRNYRKLSTGMAASVRNFSNDCDSEAAQKVLSGSNGISCGTCPSVLLSSAYPFTGVDSDGKPYECPCPDDKNIASKFCSNEYLISSTNNGTVTLKYFTTECSIGDALVDTLSRLAEFVGEVGKGLFGNLWDTIMTFIKYAVIFIGIFIVIYLLIWLADKFGLMDRIFGKKKEPPPQIQSQPPSEYPYTRPPPPSQPAPSRPSMPPEEREVLQEESKVPKVSVSPKKTRTIPASSTSSASSTTPSGPIIEEKEEAKSPTESPTITPGRPIESSKIQEEGKASTASSTIQQIQDMKQEQLYEESGQEDYQKLLEAQRAMEEQTKKVRAGPYVPPVGIVGPSVPPVGPPVGIVGPSVPPVGPPVGIVGPSVQPPARPKVEIPQSVEQISLEKQVMKAKKELKPVEVVEKPSSSNIPDTSELLEARGKLRKTPPSEKQIQKPQQSELAKKLETRRQALKEDDSSENPDVKEEEWNFRAKYLRKGNRKSRRILY